MLFTLVVVLRMPIFQDLPGAGDQVVTCSNHAAGAVEAHDVVAAARSVL